MSQACLSCVTRHLEADKLGVNHSIRAPICPEQVISRGHGLVGGQDDTLAITPRAAAGQLSNRNVTLSWWVRLRLTWWKAARIQTASLLVPMGARPAPSPLFFILLQPRHDAHRHTIYKEKAPASSRPFHLSCEDESKMPVTALEMLGLRPALPCRAHLSALVVFLDGLLARPLTLQPSAHDQRRGATITVQA